MCNRNSHTTLQYMYTSAFNSVIIGETGAQWTNFGTFVFCDENMSAVHAKCVFLLKQHLAHQIRQY